ncbi:MAG: thiamine diphosphokinase [Pseudomonadota bacterium]
MTSGTRNAYAILLDGDFFADNRIREMMADRTVIAADGGIRHADALDVTPSLWVGDFDSSDADLAKRYAHVKRRQHPPEKAHSDGELAVKIALEAGASDLFLVGALGGERTDHALFNLTLGYRLARDTALTVTLTNGHEFASPLLPGAEIKPGWSAETLFSIPGLTKLEGLTISNAKWPLDDVEVPLGSTLTLSNVGGPETVIQLRHGIAYLVARHM